MSEREDPARISWRAMRERCLSPKHKFYALYGGRGITVCPQWATFAGFLADMGPRPDGTTLDRIDPNGNYEPGNVRWATKEEQRANRRPRELPTHCSKGHEYTPENTRMKKRNTRECVTCSREYQKAYDAARRTKAVAR